MKAAALALLVLLLPACADDVADWVAPDPPRADLRLEGGWSPHRVAIVERACREWNTALARDRRCTISDGGERAFRLVDASGFESARNGAYLDRRTVVLSDEASDEIVLSVAMEAIGRFSGLVEDVGPCAVLSHGSVGLASCRHRLTARDVASCRRLGACE